MNIATSDFMFITLAGRHKGGGVSTDSLRKHVVDNFGKGMASHSLRQGGAVFYSRRGADEDATRQQGGWKTSEVMANIYAKFAPQEVREHILAVGAAASLRHELHPCLQKLGDAPEMATQAEAFRSGQSST